MERKRIAGLAFTAAALLSACDRGTTSTEDFTGNTNHPASSEKSNSDPAISATKNFVEFVLNTRNLNIILSSMDPVVRANNDNSTDRQILGNYLLQLDTCPPGIKISSISVTNLGQFSEGTAIFDQECRYKKSDGTFIKGMKVRLANINGKPSPTYFFPY